MELFTDLAQFERITAGRPKWVRTAQAIRTAPTHREGVMYSIGDSLTYLRTRRRHGTEHFTGHRRYLEVIAVGDASIRIEVAAKQNLVPCSDYSDLSDREHFTGIGQEHLLRPGQIAVIGIDDAIRYPSVSADPCIVLHVSVEGATFPNK
jgi:evolved beta-galactosidase subunit beta